MKILRLQGLIGLRIHHI